MVKRSALNRLTWFDFVLIVLLSLVGAATLYPLLYIVAISFSDSASIVQNRVFLWPKGFNIDAYKQILESPRIPRAYMNTILYTGLGTAINLLMTAVAAYPLSRPGFFGRRFFMVAIVLTMFLNGGIIPTFLIVQKLHLIDTIWAIVLPNAIWTIELLILKSFYENMSGALRESALIDGASEYRILFSIIIPLSKPALASIGLFYFMGHWNSFFLPMIYLNDAKLYPLQVVLRDMLLFDTAKETGIAEQAMLTPQALKNATIFISMIPVLLIYPFAQKYFAKGIMLGSEKG
ncbi:carbohydrate ABC transporter permease [Paenibacillus thermoaerophilus]|uniref:Carbohydrate ABC transporter permease n=1 Tax=Paenibacillus thermoaerophilus TaxID=1215385 RepID=A0ABW2V1G4_9BACL|nr:carbohydrate ABC transporter permease [Paenibacillus thermoaerophilus]TMV18528.1 carbohydrate ABC transporter permease [Paenibacillus thermoaerophilus]